MNLGSKVYNLTSFSLLTLFISKKSLISLLTLKNSECNNKVSLVRLEKHSMKFSITWLEQKLPNQAWRGGKVVRAKCWKKFMKLQ